VGPGEPEAQIGRLGALGRDHLGRYVLVPDRMEPPECRLLVIETCQPPDDRPVGVRVHAPDLDGRWLVLEGEIALEDELEPVLAREPFEREARLDGGRWPRVDVEDPMRQSGEHFVGTREHGVGVALGRGPHRVHQVDIVDSWCVSIAHEPRQPFVDHLAPELVVPLQRLVRPPEQFLVPHSYERRGPAVSRSLAFVICARLPTLFGATSTSAARARRAPTLHSSGGRDANGSKRKCRSAFWYVIALISSSGTPAASKDRMANSGDVG